MTWLFVRHGTFAGFSRGEDAGAHAGGHADAGGGDIAAEESHGVDDSQVPPRRCRRGS